MQTDFHYREKIRLGVTDATQIQGQHFVEKLHQHPWFELTTLLEEGSKIGRTYGSLHHIHVSPLPETVKNKALDAIREDLPCDIIFSASKGKKGAEQDLELAKKGYVVISGNSPTFYPLNIPVIVPHVNYNHLALIKNQDFSTKGALVLIPDVITLSVSMALKPLLDKFGIEKIEIERCRSEQETKLEKTPTQATFEEELHKILGLLQEGKITQNPFSFYVSCQPLLSNKGVLAYLDILLRKKATTEEIIESWREFKGIPDDFKLPFKTQPLIGYFHAADKLQKKAVIELGHLQKSSRLDYRFDIALMDQESLLATTGLEIAELMVKLGLIFW